MIQTPSAVDPTRDAVICIVGGSNSNDYNTNRILHHTISLPDFSQELRSFKLLLAFCITPSASLISRRSSDLSNYYLLSGGGEQSSGCSRADQYGDLGDVEGEQARLHQHQL